jgi:hypothetical protein
LWTRTPSTPIKKGGRGKDDIEDYRVPDSLRAALSTQFGVPMGRVPGTYGEYLLMLKDLGVEFYINTGFLIVSKTGTPEEPLKNISAGFFTPVSLDEMVRLRAGADYYIAY